MWIIIHNNHSSKIAKASQVLDVSAIGQSCARIAIETLADCPVLVKDVKDRLRVLFCARGPDSDVIVLCNLLEECVYTWARGDDSKRLRD